MKGKLTHVVPKMGILLGPGISSNGLALVHFTSLSGFGAGFATGVVLKEYLKIFSPR